MNFLRRFPASIVLASLVLSVLTLDGQVIPIVSAASTPALNRAAVRMQAAIKALKSADSLAYQTQFGPARNNQVLTFIDGRIVWADAPTYAPAGASGDRPASLDDYMRTPGSGRKPSNYSGTRRVSGGNPEPASSTTTTTTTSGLTSSEADSRYVNVSGDTMAGALTISYNGLGLSVSGTASGDVLHAERLLSVSGTSIFDGNARFNSTLTLNSVTYTFPQYDGASSGKVLKTNAAGQLSWSDDSATGIGLSQASGDSRYVNTSGDTMTGALTINLSSGTLGLRILQTASGNILHAEKDLTSSGTLTVVGVSRFKNNVNVAGTISGQTLQIMNGTSYVLGSLGIGTTSPKAKLEVNGTLSGSRLYVASAFSGAGLTTCSATQKLLWNATTQQFSCSTDLNNLFGTGNVLTLGDARYVNTAGDTMTGALSIALTSGTINTVGLNVLSTVSGAILHAEKTLTSSGGLVFEGAATGSSLFLGTSLRGAGLADCTTGKLLWNSSTGRFSCSTDESSGTGIDQMTGDDRYVNQSGDTMTGALTINLSSGFLGLRILQTASGNILHAEKELSSSGTLTVNGITRLKSALNVAGTISGNVLQILNTNSYVLGNIAIGKTVPKAKLDVLGTLSGSRLFVSAAFSGAGLTSCSGPQQKLVWDASLQQFSCLTDLTNSASSGGMIALTDSRYVNTSGDTMTGALTINLSSGTLGLKILQTASGNILHAEKDLSSSGTLTVVGVSRFKSNVNVVGTISGAALQIMNGTSYVLGNLGIGTNSPKAKLDVAGTISGSTLVISRNASFSGSLLVVSDITTRGTLSGNSLTVSRSASISGTLLVKTSIVTKGSLSGTTIAGFSLGSCNAATQKLLYNNSTQKFECGSDANNTFFGSGNVLTLGDNRYVKKQGDTMTGALTINLTTGSLGLRILQTASGNILHAEKALTSSGMLMVAQRRTQGRAALFVWQQANSTGVTIRGSGSQINAPLLALDSSTGSARAPHILFGYAGRFDVALYRLTTSTLALSGHLLPGLTNKFDLGSSAARWRSLYLSGGTLHLGTASNQASINFNTSASRFGIDANTDGTNELSILSTGNVGIGTIAPKAKLDVQGTISGSNLVISRSASISGTLLVSTSIVSKGSVSGATIRGFGLSPCSDASNSKLLYNNATGQFECGSDIYSVFFATGNVLTIGDARYVKKQGDTMTGTLVINLTSGSLGLRILQTTSGSILHAEKTMTSSGFLKVTQRRVQGSGAVVVSNQANSTGMYILSSSRMHPVLALDGATGSARTPHILFGQNGNFDVAMYRLTGATLALSGHLVPGLTNKFDLGSNGLRWRSLYLSGGTLYLGTASNQASINYNTSASRFGIDANTDGTNELSILSTGNVGIGTIAPKAKLDVQGTISGSNLVISRSASISGTLLVSSRITSKSTVSGAMISGFSLGSCNDANNSKLLYNNSTQKFECGTDQSSVGGMDYSEAAGIFVKKSGDTMTGALMIDLTSGSLGLKIVQTASGNIIHAEKTLTSSGIILATGTMATRGTLSGKTLTVMRGDSSLLGSVGIGKSGTPKAKLDVLGTISGAVLVISGNGSFSGSLIVKNNLSGSALFGFGLGSCTGDSQKLLYNNSTGKFSCASDQTGAGATTGTVLTIGDARYVKKQGDTMTGTLKNRGYVFSSGTTLVEMSGWNESLNLLDSGLMTNNVTRLTNQGDLKNIGTLQAGEANFRRGGTFLPRSDYTTGTGPRSVATGDLNGDGKADFVVTNTSSNTLSIFLGSGTGGFLSRTNYATGTSPIQVSIADLNGDGKQDIAVTNGDANTVSVFINKGDGTLRTKVDYASGMEPYGIVTADLNEDGRNDIVITNYEDQTISVYRNRGDGTFDARTNYATPGIFPHVVQAGDFNGDGKADIVLGHITIAGIYIYYGNGDGTLASAQQINSLAAVKDIAVADLNGDMKDDIAAPHGLGSIGVLLNSGTGSFAPTATYSTGDQGNYSIIHSDFNADGYVDLAVLNGNINYVAIFLNKRNGTFVLDAKYTVGTQGVATPRLISAADLNGDGKSDLAVVNAGETTLSVFLNDSKSILYASSGTGGAVGIGTSTPNSALSVSGAMIIHAGGNLENARADSGITLEIVGTSSGRVLHAQGGLRSSGSLIVDGTISGATLEGLGLVSCTGANQKLIYSVATGKFSCGSDTVTQASVNSGSVVLLGDARYVNTSGDTMTGALTISLSSGYLGLRIINTASGNIIHAEKSLSSSGTILATGAMTTQQGSLSGASFFGARLGSCTGSTQKLLYNASTGTFSCTTDSTDDGTGLTSAVATNIFVNQSGDTMTGALTINLTSGTLGLKIVQTASGNILHAEKDLSSSGTLTVVGVSRFKNNVNVVGTISGAALQIMHGTSYVLGNLGIGTIAPKAKLDVQGTISGKTLVISGNGSFSGALIVKNNLSGSTISGFSLGTCNGTTQKLLYNNSTNKFECGADSQRNLIGSGNVLTIGDGRYVRKSGGTMTGALTMSLASGSLGLKIMNTASGNIIHAEKTLTSSGNIIAGTDIVARGTMKSDAFVFSSGTTLAEMSGWNEYLNVVHSGIGTNSITRLAAQGDLKNIGTIQGGEANFRRGGTFTAKIDKTTGSVPSSVAAGDLNGDGKADLAVTNHDSNSVSVFINNGSSVVFANKVDYATGTQPNSVATGDLNGDGVPDLAVANLGADSVSVLLNNGNGTFAAKVDYTTAAGSRSVAIGDLNGDGKADLAVTDFTAALVSIFLNNGNGTFLAKVDYETGTQPFSVAIGDLNGDGKADLVTSNNGDSLSVLFGLRNGTFSAKTDYAAGAEPRSVAIGDLNGDGKSDLASVDFGANTVSAYMNNGDGTFAAKVDYSTNSAPTDVAIGDLNGDGKADLVTSNSINLSFSVLLNNGNGTFATKEDYTTAGQGSSIAIAHFNSDGKPDIAVTNSTTTNMSVFLNIPRTILFASSGTGGAVGIGTSTPGSALAVSGAVIINRGGNLFNARADTGVTLEVIGTASGRTLHAQDLLRSSGSLVIEKTATFGSGVFINTRHTTARANVLTIITDYSINNNTVFRISASGSVYADGVYNSAGADYAEWFKDGSMEGVEGREGAEGKKPLQPGEVACIDVLHNNTVKRCERSGDPNLMGIVSTNPAFVGNVISGAEGLIPPGYALIGLIGQVPAKPTLENGQIFPGDAVTSASVPGFIRKASAGESTVGVALEAYNGEIPNSKNQIPTINILISRRNQSLTVETLEQKVLDQIASMNLTDQIAQLVNQASINLNIDDRVTEALNAELNTFDLASEVNMLVDEHLTALRQSSGQALTFGQSLHFGSGQALTGADLTSLAQAVAAELALATSEQVTATGSSTENYELGMMNYESRLKDLEEQFALRFGSGQALSFTETSTGSLHGSATSLVSDSGATINGTLKLSGALILSTSSSQIGPINLSGSAVTIGSLMSTGSLTLLGNLTINGLATFFGDVHIKGELVLSNRQAGFAVIPASGTAVTVTFSGGMVSVPIVIATPDDLVAFGITNVSQTGFTITLREPVSTEINFSFVAWGSDKPTTVTGTIPVFSSVSAGVILEADIPAATLTGQALLIDNILSAASSGTDILSLSGSLETSTVSQTESGSTVAPSDQTESSEILPILTSDSASGTTTSTGVLMTEE